jgi:hypothetical protein
VRFGGTAAAITANTATSITVTIQAHAAGTADVVVTTAGRSATFASGYTFAAIVAIINVEVFLPRVQERLTTPNRSMQWIAFSNAPSSHHSSSVYSWGYDST